MSDLVPVTVAGVHSGKVHQTAREARNRCDALTFPSRWIFLMVWASAVMTSSDLCGINGAMKVARKQGMAGDRPHRILHKSGEGFACP